MRRWSRYLCDRQSSSLQKAPSGSYPVKPPSEAAQAFLRWKANRQRTTAKSKKEAN